jgi:hypothetical protein
VVAKELQKCMIQYMDTPSPYQSPESVNMPQPPPDLPMMATPEPSSIKVFGIMHLVIAAYGLFSAAASVLSTAVVGGISKNFPAGAAGSSEAAKAAMALFMQETAVFTYMGIGFTVILAIMLIIAGIGLLRAKEQGRLMSIRYAWVSIGTKVITLIFTITHVIPATKKFAKVIYQDLPGVGGDTMGAIMQYSQLFGILISCTYPVIVLVFMKGEKIKEYMAARAAA